MRQARTQGGRWPPQLDRRRRRRRFVNVHQPPTASSAKHNPGGGGAIDCSRLSVCLSVVVRRALTAQEGATGTLGPASVQQLGAEL